MTDILEHGLWMTEQKFPNLNGLPKIDPWPCTCFTELKLSESRKHAQRYGRLGIGFNRPFIIEREGRPVTYFSAMKKPWLDRDQFLHECARKIEPRMMHFFQPMNSGGSLNYDLYSESEWRIVFNEGLFKRLREGEVDRVVNPRDSSSRSHDYFESLTHQQQDHLRFLIPVDGWLAVIIYPSLKIKAMATANPGIRAAMKSIKSLAANWPNRVEPGNMPVEMDLDLCRNF